MIKNDKFINIVKWNSEGIIPVIAQEFNSNKVLMMAWMNKKALKKTIEIGQAVYWSRSRGKLWHKGEESGNFQIIEEMRIDCDNDTLLLIVKQVGNIACHTGRHSCFFRKLINNDIKNNQWIETENLLKHPSEIYKKKYD
tara:strand:+ start:588 stop:1007 length:420 start_codon:yes stop_codon:yes gene_type:complete